MKTFYRRTKTTERPTNPQKKEREKGNTKKEKTDKKSLKGYNFPDPKFAFCAWPSEKPSYQHSGKMTAHTWLF